MSGHIKLNVGSDLVRSLGYNDRTTGKEFTLLLGTDTNTDTRSNFKKLECVQYSLARVVTGMPVYSRDHMMPVLAKLHWLPICARVSFKIATMVFKVRQTGQPSYLAELIEDAVPSRTLRSSASRQCTLKESRTVLCYGTRAFRQTAVKTWNSLPGDVRLSDKLETFRSRLKTHLYRLSYC